MMAPEDAKKSTGFWAHSFSTLFKWAFFLCTLLALIKAYVPKRISTHKTASSPIFWFFDSTSVAGFVCNKHFTAASQQWVLLLTHDI